MHELALPVGSIGPIGGQILGDEVDLLDATLDQGFRFGDNYIHRLAPQSSPDQGNCAVGTPVIAAFAYLQIGAAGEREQLIALIHLILHGGIGGNGYNPITCKNLPDHLIDL